MLVWALICVLVTAFLPGLLGALPDLDNPVGLGLLAPVSDALLSTLFVLLPVLVALGAGSLVVRWRRAGARERGALRWLAAAALVVGISAPLAMLTEAGEILQGLAFLLLPIAIAAGVVREQLWDLELRRDYDQLRTTRERERDRLRHELHDSLGPVLGSISMRAEAARNLLAAGHVDRIDELLASIDAATQDALSEVRRLLDDLSPSALGSQDLVPVLENHLASYANSFPVRFTVAPVPFPVLDSHAAATAWFIVVESVRNAARHSKGTGASVSLTAHGDRLRITVSDDGLGIGTAPAGLGRVGMFRRAADEGGHLTVTEPPDGGTVVTLVLPGAVR